MTDLKKARKLIKQMGLEPQKDPEFVPLIRHRVIAQLVDPLAEPQEFTLLRSRHRAFRLVDLQLQLVGQERSAWNLLRLGFPKYSIAPGIFANAGRSGTTARLLERQLSARNWLDMTLDTPSKSARSMR